MDVVCHKLSGVLRAITPLHIGTGTTTGTIKHCRSLIPGAVLRGVVGTALIKTVCRLDKPKVDHENCEYFDECVYAQLFGEEFGKSSRVFFRFSYPLHLKCGGIFLPTQKTIYKCFNPQCGKLFDVSAGPSECDVCGSSVKIAQERFRCRGCKELKRSPIRTSRITLTAISRGMSSAAQVAEGEETAGTLHTLEVIHRGSRFGFEIIVHRDFVEAVSLLKSIIERALPDEGIGGSKSRGLGKVIAEDLRVERIVTGMLDKRADEINTKRFRVQLVSPMILNGKPLEPTSLSEGVRRAYTWAFREGKPSLPEVKLEHRAGGGELFSGWSLKSGKRRKVESAISAGSVFEFSCDVDSRELALGLAALEYLAIGAYKPHGCGQVIIEKPLH